MEETVTEREPAETRRSSLLIAVLAGLVAVIFGVLWYSARGTEPAEVTDYLSDHVDAATGTAEEVLLAVITYSPDTVEEQAAKVRELGTGTFLEDYEALLREGLGEVVSETAARSDGEIATGPEIAFTSAERATAVARVVQEVTSAGAERPRTVFSVMRLGLVLQGGIWKADRLEILSQNSL